LTQELARVGWPVSGEVAEWLKAPVSKTGIPVSGIGGSNPPLSARTLELLSIWLKMPMVKINCLSEEAE
jgi:hypothetical protein